MFSCVMEETWRREVGVLVPVAAELMDNKYVRILPFLVDKIQSENEKRETIIWSNPEMIVWKSNPIKSMFPLLRETLAFRTTMLLVLKTFVARDEEFPNTEDLNQTAKK